MFESRVNMHKSMHKSTYIYPWFGHRPVLGGNWFSVLHQHLDIAGSTEGGGRPGVGRSCKFFPGRNPVKPAGI